MKVLRDFIVIHLSLFPTLGDENNCLRLKIFNLSIVTVICIASKSAFSSKHTYKTHIQDNI